MKNSFKFSKYKEYIGNFILYGRSMGAYTALKYILMSDKKSYIK